MAGLLVSELVTEVGERVRLPVRVRLDRGAHGREQVGRHELEVLGEVAVPSGEGLCGLLAEAGEATATGGWQVGDELAQVAHAPGRTYLLTSGQGMQRHGACLLDVACGLARPRSRMQWPAHKRVGGPDAHVEVIADDSHFTASRVLVMPDLLSRGLGTDAPHGVLVAMPARHWAFIHVLADKTATPSLLKMASMARIAHGREQGPISPDVFWWRDGDWMPVPFAESDGKITLCPGPELSFLLADLAARPARG